MPTLAFDLGFLETGVEELQAYLLSEHLFWPLGSAAPWGEGSFPQLTLGGLLIALARSRARAVGATPTAHLARLEQRLEAVRSRWRTAWGQKAAREFQSRLNQWRNYLDEYHQNPPAHVVFYPQEVRLRVQLHLLEPEALDLEAGLVQLLAGLDARLRRFFTRGEFIWEPEMSIGFPREEYWYLYGGLKARR